jgi:hypothetical protein
MCLVLAGLLGYVAAAPTEQLFGRVHFDDGVLFSSAQTLAAGDGYVIASAPGAPAQTKCPVFYPWLLSLVWRVNPRFPENVGWAVWLNAFFGCAFLVVSFLYLRRQPGVGDWIAVTCVALTSTYARILDLSASLMSDIPFMALAMTALLLAEIAEARNRSWLALPAGLAAGLAFLTRTAGVAFVVAVAVAALLRRDWRRAALLIAGSAPFVLGHQLWSVASKAAVAPETVVSRGWLQLSTYMTSYPDFWKLSTPDLDIFLAMLNANFVSLLLTPAQMVLFAPPASLGSFFGFLLGIALSAGVMSGMLRHARRTGWTAIHTALLLTAGLSLFWNFPIAWRLLAVFLPLFCLGAILEARYIFAMAAATIGSDRPIAEKALSGLVAAAVVAAGLFTVVMHIRGPLNLRASVARAASGFADQEQVYRWVRENTAESDILLAYADARLYLETGRRAVWPAAFTTDVLYRGDVALEEQMDHYLDVARHLRARYWIVGPSEIAADTEIGKRRFAEMQRPLPVVFETADGSTRIYDLAGLHPRTPTVSDTASR